MKLARNYIDGQWVTQSSKRLKVVDPGKDEIIGEVVLSSEEEVHHAVISAQSAFPSWRATPATERIQYLFKLKVLLDENIESLARTITIECGKTIAESKGELKRAIENVEVACGIPMMMQSEFSEDISSGIDEFMIRQPLGVAACITPFNFPGMIPFWFLPYAVACGNTYLVKPSEKVPFTMQKVFELIEEAGFPKGVLNLVNGGKESVDAILRHPQIKAISFVGSSDVARYIYSESAKYGKRVQAQGGAKNPVIILPDADIDVTSKIISDSVYGCAGQRCLATSTVITVGESKAKMIDSLIDSASNKIVGYGLDENVEMGSLITEESKKRVYSLVDKSIAEGGKLVLDGRKLSGSNLMSGYYMKPTIIADVNPEGEVFQTEVFGPVMGIISIETIEDAIKIVNSGRYGNAASIFTSSGSSARKFRYEANTGNVGINIGIAAPMAFFPFSGWRESFYGDLHGQGKHAVEFFTQTKVVIERWPKEWSRKF
ncbi:MAG: CoA-acylating methylmalonate-semialdehyde dehydrogenase [Melioribacteraceae bacterium]|nr:CoA-acylating methylmalonate-semialdehyde dehydrogenase [Melioribacteraceae bacterium]